ncbi:MAG: DoxX family protein [Rhodoglobus sp.]|jgi:uncharacterized membrane protein YphA (DoxX/SURF4 family)|nr:DoxX family protein [Rhodoglobus sp.]
MTIAVWIVSGLVALLYLMAGGRKVTTAEAKLPATFPFVEATGVPLLRVIGALEVLGAVGVIVPAATGILPILTPIAATGLALIMVAAIVFHVRRGELKSLPFNIVLLVLPAFVAVARFAGF